MPGAGRMVIMCVCVTAGAGLVAFLNRWPRLYRRFNRAP